MSYNEEKKFNSLRKVLCINHSFKEGNNKMLLFCNDIACFYHTVDLNLIIYVHIYVHTCII